MKTGKLIGTISYLILNDAGLNEKVQGSERDYKWVENGEQQEDMDDKGMIGQPI